MVVGQATSSAVTMKYYNNFSTPLAVIQTDVSPPPTFLTLESTNAGGSWAPFNPGGSWSGGFEMQITGTIPVATPGPPTAVTATATNAQASVSWNPPTSTGGAPITSYTVTASPGGQTCTAPVATPEVDSCTVTGLTNGTSYTFTATATNKNGASSASAGSAAVVPHGPPLPIPIPIPIPVQPCRWPSYRRLLQPRPVSQWRAAHRPPLSTLGRSSRWR